MEKPPTRDDRWQSLVHAAEHIETAGGKSARDEWLTLLEQLRSLKEIFGPELDPNEDFEGYAVRRLVKAIERALAQPRAEGRASAVARGRRH